MRPELRIRRGRTWLEIAALVVLALGFALFVAVLREGRATPATVSAGWAAVFALTLAGTAAWNAVYVTGVATTGRRAFPGAVQRALLTSLPLTVPGALALAAFASDSVNHDLTQADRWLWLWGTAIGIWVALQVVTLVTGLDGLTVGRPRIGSWPARLRRLAEPELTFGLVLAQFVTLRVLVALLWRPWGVFERGSDVGAYEQRARLALRGLQPYLDYWVEYPPVFPWTASGLKLLTLHLGGSEGAFQILFSLLMALFETGTLVLIYRIATTVWDPRRGLAAAIAYALLFYPLYIANRNFEAIAVFFLLLGVYAVVRGHRHSAALALSLGLLAKVFPLAGFPALVAGGTFAGRVRLVALTLAGLAGALVPLAVAGREFFAASIQNMALRPGWETVWALADGYFSFGWIHRFREAPDTARQFNYTPDLPPAVWLAGAAALLGFYAYLAFRHTRPVPAAPVWMTGAALAAFAVYLKGWSPQFMVWMLPLVVIAYPGGVGFLLATALSGLALLESPAYFLWWSDRPWVLWVIVIVRTLALAGLGLMFLRRLRALDGKSAVPDPAPVR